MIESGNEGVGLRSLLEGEWDMSSKRGHSGNGDRGGGSTVPTKHTGGSRSLWGGNRVCDSEACSMFSWKQTAPGEPTHLSVLKPRKFPQTTGMHLT